MALRLDFRKLKYIVTAAETSSLTAAANKLAISQPALTRCISDVEENLEMQLFLRLPRGIALTDEGEKFVSRARVLLSDLEDLGDDFMASSGKAKRRLKLGAAPGTYLSLLALPIARLAAEHPDLEISTTQGRPQEVLPKLETGELDIVLSGSGHLEQWPELKVNHIAPLKFAYMVRKDHPALKSGKFTEADLLKYPAILSASTDWLLHEIAELHEKVDVPSLKPTYVSDDFGIVSPLLNLTDAYCPVVLTQSSINSLSEIFGLANISTPLKNRYLSLAYPKTRATSPAVRTLEEAIQKEFGE